MNKDEYLINLKTEYEMSQRRNKKRFTNYLVKDLCKMLIVLLVFFIFHILRLKIDIKQFERIFFGLTRLCLIVGGIMIVIFLATVFLMIRTLFYTKNIYKYLSGEKHFEYDSVYISKEIFDFSLTFAGFMAMYVKINDKIYYLEAQLKKINYSGENAGIGDCYINFCEAMSLEQFLNYKIDGTKIDDINKFEILSVNNHDPQKFIDEFNKYSERKQ